MLRRYAAFLLALSLLTAGVAVNAQTTQRRIESRTDPEAIARIKEEALKRSQVMEMLSYLTDIYGARLTNSPSIKAAQKWASHQLTGWGLQNVRLEAWGPFGRGWSLEAFTSNMTKPAFTPLIAYAKAWSPSTRGTVRDEVVYLDAKSEADLEKYRGKLKGAIVMVSPPREVKAHFTPQATRETDEELLKLANAETPSGEFRRREQTPEEKAADEMLFKKQKLCYAEGAAVILEAGRGDGGTVFVQSATYPESPDVPRDRRVRVYAADAPALIPQAVIAPEQYNRIVRMITKGVPVQLEINITSRFYDQDLMSYNVIGEIPGTDLKDEVVMLGAHFDSWHTGTGATDNAAGSVVCLEAVRILQALGIKPRRTIRIALWSGEEQGLRGSRAYVAEHFGKRINQPRSSPAEGATTPAPPQIEIKPAHEKVAGYFNLDNGTGKVRGVYMQGNEAVRAIFRQWLAPFEEMGASTLTLRNTSGTDHVAFDEVGLPGFQFIQDEVEYESRTHHSNMDVYDRIQEDDLKQAAAIMAAFVYNTAMLDKKLPRKPLPGQPTAQSAMK